MIYGLLNLVLSFLVLSDMSYWDIQNSNSRIFLLIGAIATLYFWSLLFPEMTHILAQQVANLNGK